MAYILTLENDENFVDSLNGAIKSISVNTENKVFTNTADIEKYILSLNGPTKEEDQITVVILASELLPKDAGAWIKNQRQLLTSKGYGTSINPVRVLVIAFDNVQIAHKAYEIPEVFTYFFKPCDELILKEIISFAISGYIELKSHELNFRKLLDSLEMLKQIQFDEISEVGFVTTSDALFKTSGITKYYSPFFDYNNKSFAFARLVSCIDHPAKPGLFQCFFEYMGIDNNQLNAMRKKILSAQTVKVKNDYTYNWFGNQRNMPNLPIIKVAILIEDELIRANLTESLSRVWKNIQIVELVAPTEKGQAPTPCDLVILDDAHNNETLPQLLPIEAIRILITDKTQSEIDLREKSLLIHDILFLPLDKSYVNKKLKIILHSLQANEEQTIASVHGGFTIKAVMPVQITQASENHVEFSYHRSLDQNDLREFAIYGELAQPHIEIKARCQFVQKGTDKDLPFSHQFLFLGQKDFYTKQIRLWLHRLHVTAASKKL